MHQIIKENILIAGIAGASLGTEIFKSLSDTSKYNIFGADISPYAYGLYQNGFKKTFSPREDKYIEDILNFAKNENIKIIIPGGEIPLKLLSNKKTLFENEGIKLAINNLKVIDLCTDKIKTFNKLKELNIPIPKTELYLNKNQLDHISYPSIIKPSKNSGGSINVYLAENKSEALYICESMKKNNQSILIQEYLNSEKGEFTIGVLSDAHGKIIQSIIMKKVFPSKLSYILKNKKHLISSGYSQGEFINSKELNIQAEHIAQSIQSTGPLNIQARIKNNILYPFEINPRFSATTYLRTLAGFNEIDIYLQYLFTNKLPNNINIKTGFCLRSLTEQFIPKDQL
ncbi:MAG: Carbamoyl-phosphate synthase large chain [Candidatus Anoxychlamydiales bacterium]|nr:Carbamoyl-phosphate synthase large chain [Candidatus Anoxychlamydiales bacterium]